MQATAILDLSELGKGSLGLTPNFGASLAEAAGVSLEREGHNSGVEMTVVAKSHSNRKLLWPVVTEQTRRSWNDPQDATEFGATGMALLLTQKLLNLVAVDRSAKGPGFDYWIGDESDIPFERKARLEISGIARGDEATVGYRIKQKVKQTDKSDGAFPAFIVVVEFGRPVSHLVVKNEQP